MSSTVDSITDTIINRAMSIHTRYGPGLLEKVYTLCLGHELLDAGLMVDIHKPLPLEHDGLRVDRGFEIDLLVENQVIVEVKSVQGIAPIHTAQLLTYLRLTGIKVGLIINFNVTSLRLGIKRVVNNYEDNGRKG